MASNPTESCDVIFRGGITSGVVYPGVVEALAQKYRFGRIGGASAGAIAAGLTAAAEYGRQQGRGFEPFTNLGQTGHDVGGGKGSVTSLGNIFRASPRLIGLQRLVLLAMGHKGLAAAALVLALLAPLLLALASPWAGLLAYGLLLFVALPWIAWQLLRVLPQEGFGLCSGVRPGIAQDIETLRREGALSDWLHAEIQRAAGRRTGPAPSEADAALHRPLTMGDLWGEGPQRAIDLVLTTTNLSQQLPHSFPFLEKSRAPLYFSPDALARVLPRDVVDWMVRHAAAEEVGEPRAPSGWLRLPAARDLPILLGIRMSLSFPGLVAAVPLHARRPDVPLRTDGCFEPETCWFSDGGITSNFPIHLFDATLPRCPTFCVTLRPATQAELTLTEARKGPGFSPDPLVVMPTRNASDIAPRFAAPIGASLPSFLGAIIDTARNGHENELMLMPGQRDRIVHILTQKGEGGLNLGMPDGVIEALVARGKVAGELLVSRFHPEGAAAQTDFRLGWRNQRWVRLRSSLAALERLLADFARGWRAEQPGQSDYSALMAKPPSYDWRNDDSAECAAANIQRILELADALRSEAGDATVFDGKDGKGGAPHPKLGLRMRPIGGDPNDRRSYS